MSDDEQAVDSEIINPAPGEQAPALTPHALTLTTHIEIRHDGTAVVLSTPLEV